MSDNIFNKIASLAPSTQLMLMAETLEKVALDRQTMIEKLAVFEREAQVLHIYNRLDASGNAHWPSRDEGMTYLRKLAVEGKLGMLTTLDELLPGTLGKVAAGLTSMTDGESQAGRPPSQTEARERFFEGIMSFGMDE